jgi:hypothetical protein
MHANRALLVALGVLGLAYSAVLLRENGPAGVPWLPGCTIRSVTGLDCAGCGMTRATHALLHGRIMEAFRFNPVGLVLLPAALVALALEVAGWVRGRPLPWRLRPGPRAIWALVAVILAFTVLRNIPMWPLTLLSPP